MMVFNIPIEIFQIDNGAVTARSLRDYEKATYKTELGFRDDFDRLFLKEGLNFCITDCLKLRAHTHIRLSERDRRK